MRRLLLALALVAVATPAFASPKPTPTPTTDSKVVTFGVQPSGPTKPDSRGYFTFSVTPGARLSDYAAVQNYSLRPITVTMSATDAINTVEGDFALLPNTAKPKDIGRWVTLPKKQRFTIPARSYTVVPFQVVVPNDASPGDHVGGIVVTLHSEAKSKTGQRYELLQNVGSRIFARVSGDAMPLLAIENPQIRYRRGRATFTYDVRNSGNVALGARQSVHVSGVASDTAARGVPDIKLLLPGSTVHESVSVKGVLPQGLMRGRVRLDPLVVPGSPGAAPVTTATTTFWAVPTVLLLALLGLMLVAALAWWLRHRTSARPARGRHRHPVSGTATTAATTAVILLALVALAPLARADGTPYTDRDATGVVGFCDENGRQLTSGRIDARPFVWRVVSSVPAPSGYTKATLYGFQPRKEHDPGEWSGQQLTASSTFSNPDHPMAQATYGDRALVDFVQAFPPDWDGLVQVRLYFSAPGVPVHSRPYPATSIRVSGDTWQVVGDPGPDHCGSGSATSIETQYLPKNKQPTSPPPSPGPKAAGASARPAATSPVTGDRAAHADDGGPFDAVSTPTGAGIGLGLFALLGLGAVVLLRRRRPSLDLVPKGTRP